VSGAGFTDSIEHNVALIEELMSQLPLQHRNEARRAAMAIEKVFNDLKRSGSASPGMALGTAFAFFKISENLVKPGSKSAGGESLIQLLN
jgi:hypothetical protein